MKTQVKTILILAAGLTQRKVKFMKCHPASILRLLSVLLLGFPALWDSNASGELVPGVSNPEATSLLDVFPPSSFELPPELQGKTRLSNVYTPTGSLWREGLNEEKVFLFEILQS